MSASKQQHQGGDTGFYPGARSIALEAGALRAPRVAMSQRLARTVLHKQLAAMSHGRLLVTEAGQTYAFGEPAEHAQLTAHLHIHDPRVYTAMLSGGAVGAGEAFMSGYWSSPDLVRVIQFFVANIDNLRDIDSRRSLPHKMASSLLRLRLRNSERGSRRNISAHYDLGNDFFALFLDPRMMYSSALYEHAQMNLAEASTAKLDSICRQLELKPDDHLLEIGTGWGGMAIYAAEHYGCKVTTTTISKQQYEYARAAVASAGLEGQVTVLAEDYRALEGQYDKIVSIEMIEAVGFEYFGQYFEKCSALLKDDGLMLLQAITIADQRYEVAKRSVDFIQRYIFPGGCLPSVTSVCEHVTRHSDMNLVSLKDLGQDYARTLRDWRTAFHAERETVQAMGYDQQFIRMWDYYLAYCEGGFLERSISAAHFLLAKPGYRDQRLAVDSD